MSTYPLVPRPRSSLRRLAGAALVVGTATARNGRLSLKSASPAVDKVKKAAMRRDLRGRKVGVDANGDGKRGSDIGALEAKNTKRRH